MPEKEAEKYNINPFDLTKVWHHADYPLIEVGTLELNRNPVNHFAEVEQVAFGPGNLPPGFGPSPDKVLQARLQAYPDAHRYRVGVNHTQIDVNKPRCPMHAYHRDGQTRFDGNGGGSPAYQPNSFDGAADNADYAEPPLRIDGNADRYNHRDGNDDYTQAGDLYRLMDDDAKTRLINNIANAMQGVPKEIQVKQLVHFVKADPSYGKGIACKLGINPAEIS